MAGPEVRYAQNAGVNIAFQVFGEGPRDLVFVCGTMSHLDLFWADRNAAAMLERLGRFCRVILFDKPGTGLSDPLPAAPTLEQRADDVAAVMDAAGSERAVLVGFSEGGLPAVLLAATRPHRVEALIALDTLAAMEFHDDMVDVAPEVFEVMWGILDSACERWGQGILLSALAVSWVDDPFYGPLLGATERACMSPGMARSVLQGYHGMDVREAAVAVRVPTLVLHAPEPFLVPGLGRDLARRIPGATFVELPGPDHLPWINNGELFPRLVEEFVTGQVAEPNDDDDRILTTVVFTDIVDSTRRLADLGDAEWRRLLVDHDRLLDGLLERFAGIAVKHTGDGRFSHFARPARAVRFAVELTERARQLGLEIRAGIHTGECEAVAGDLFGLAVNVGARVASLAQPGEILVSSTVKDLVLGSGLGFVESGVHELKGVPGRWVLHACVHDRPGPLLVHGYETDVREPIATQ